MKAYKPKRSGAFYKIICLICICILINGITFKYEKENIVTRNENLRKNIERSYITEEFLVAEIASKKVEAAKKASETAPDKYKSLPEKGFNVTNGHKTYELSSSDYILLAAVLASEANKSSIDDILAVSSVILNRADTKGISPVTVVTAPGQFSGYLDGYYLRYIDENGNLRNVNQALIDTLNDALGGIRNNQYYSFRSWSTTGYSQNYISEYGNRYN